MTSKEFFKDFEPMRDFQLWASSTRYYAFLEQENPLLTKLKTHFSLLDDENDEVDQVEPNYYYRSPSQVVWFFVYAIMVLIVLFLWGKEINDFLTW